MSSISLLWCWFAIGNPFNSLAAQPLQRKKKVLDTILAGTEQNYYLHFNSALTGALPRVQPDIQFPSSFCSLEIPCIPSFPSLSIQQIQLIWSVNNHNIHNLNVNFLEYSCTSINTQSGVCSFLVVTEHVKTVHERTPEEKTALVCLREGSNEVKYTLTTIHLGIRDSACPQKSENSS